jgi:hypothetical protein
LGAWSAGGPLAMVRAGPHAAAHAQTAIQGNQIRRTCITWLSCLQWQTGGL